MPFQSFKEKLQMWKLMSNNARPHLEANPQLRADQAALEALLAQGESLDFQQGVQTAALRQTNEDRRNLQKQGDRLHEKLATGLKHVFGVDNKQLIEFGVKPKAERRRKAPLTPEQRKQLAVERLKKQLAELESASPATPPTP